MGRPGGVAPAHDVPMGMLTLVADAVCSGFKVRHMYAEQHKDALAAVGLVLDSILCNAEHIGQLEVCRCPSKHWDLSISPPVPVEWREAPGLYVRGGIPYLRLKWFSKVTV